MEQDTPLFTKYVEAYQKDPKSKVFAPLAESYRNMGNIEKAMEILNRGIKDHPDYVLGYVGLAWCYYDEKKYHQAYNTLKPLIPSQRENLKLQDLFAKICEELGHREEALETYKYILFINPKDKNVAKKVDILENTPDGLDNELFSEEISEEVRKREPFDTESLSSTPVMRNDDTDNWVKVDFSTEDKNTKTTVEEENWSQEQLQDIKQVDDSSQEEEEEIGFVEEEDHTFDTGEVPVVTHTLVDLYMTQGHKEKALELLEKFRELNPDDEVTNQKLSELKKDLGRPQLVEGPTIDTESVVDEKPAEENVSSQNLMDYFDEKVGENRFQEDHESRLQVVQKLQMLQKAFKNWPRNLTNRL